MSEERLVWVFDYFWLTTTCPLCQDEVRPVQVRISADMSNPSYLGGTLIRGGREVRNIEPSCVADEYNDALLGLSRQMCEAGQALIREAYDIVDELQMQKAPPFEDRGLGG